MPGEHYYASRPTSAHKPCQFSFTHRDRTFDLVSDAGVFSHQHLDRGTKLLLKALAVPPAAARLADLGCGYGPIGLVLASLAPLAEVYLIDPNERACDLAMKNAVRNGLENIIVKRGEGLAGVPGPIDLIATNPPIRAGKQAVYGLMAEATERLSPGGELWTVIRTNQGAESLKRELCRLFPDVSEMEKGGGFRVYRAVKSRSPLI